MAQPLTAKLPPDCTLSAGYVVRITCLDPTSGAVVSGVRLTEISVFVTDLAASIDAGAEAPMPLLVPTDDGG